MHRDRLRLAAEVLDGLPEGAPFDIDSYAECPLAKLSETAAFAALGLTVVVMDHVPAVRLGNAAGIEVAEVLFGLDAISAHRAFTKHGYPKGSPVTPALVAARLRELADAPA